MAENEETGGAGDSGFGLAITATVGFGPETKADISDSFNKTVDAGIESNLRKILKHSSKTNDKFQAMSKLLSNMALSNDHVGKDPAFVSAMEQFKMFGQRVEAMRKPGITNTAFRKETNNANVTMTRAMTALKQLYPAASMPKRGASDPGSESFKALAGQINTAAIRQASLVRTAAKASGLDVSKVTPRGLVYEPSGSAQTFSSPQARQGFDLRKRFEQASLDKAKGLIGETKGISLDTETANAAGDLWAVAYRTEKTGMVKLQQNLNKAGIQADEFHKGYVKNLTENAGESVGSIVSKFHDAWAATSPTGTLTSGALPPISAHNLTFDLHKMQLAAVKAAGLPGASDLDKGKANNLRTAIDSIVKSSGVNNHMLQTGDTARGWADFVKNDLGYTAHQYAGKANSFGNSLPSIAAALGIKTASHDVTADTRMTDLLQRSFASQTGRESLKAMFNTDGAGFAPWMAEAEKGSYASKFRSGVATHFGKENMHVADQVLAGGMTPGLDPISQGKDGKDGIKFSSVGQLHDAVRSSNAESSQKYRQQLLASRLTDFGPASIPEVTSVEDQQAVLGYSKEKFSAASSKVTGLLHQGITSRVKATGGKFEGNEYEYAIDDLLDEQGSMSDYLRNTVQTLGITDVEQQKAALSRVKNTFKNAFLENSRIDKGKASALETIATDTDREALGKYDIAIPDADSPSDLRPGSSIVDTNAPVKAKLNASVNELNTVLKNDLGKVFDDLATPPPIAKRFKELFKEDLRVSDLSAVTAGRRTLPELIEQGKTSKFYDASKSATKGVQVEQTGPEDAFARGNRFEDVLFGKGSPVLNKYDTFKTGAGNQLDSRIGGFNAHADGFLRNKETGEVSIAEAKYRGNNTLAEVIKTGKVPPAWITQTNAYALAAGQPNMPTTFLMGNTEKRNAVTDELERKMALGGKGGYSKAQIAKFELERDAEAAKIGLSQERLGTVGEITIQPDAAIQKGILEQIAAVNGMDATKPKNLEKIRKDITGLPADVIAGLIGGSGKDLTSLIDAQRTKAVAADKKNAGKSTIGLLKESKELQDAVAELSAGGTGKGSQSKQGQAEVTIAAAAAAGAGGAGSGGGGNDGNGNEPPKFLDDHDNFEDRWNPNVNLSKDERRQLAEKRFQQARLSAESLDLDLNAKKKYLENKTGAKLTRNSTGEYSLGEGQYDIHNRGELLSGLRETQEKADAAKALAQGYQAEVDGYALDELTKKPLTRDQAIDKRAGEITRDKDLLKSNEISAAKEAATNASAFIKTEGLNTDTLAAASNAAKKLRELGAAGEAGYTEQQLYKKANIAGVAYAEPKLKDVTGGMQDLAKLQGVQGKTGGMAEMTAEASSASKAVESLFKQLSQHTGKDFMSNEAKSIQGFITAAQEGQQKALEFREKANRATEIADAARTSGSKTGKADAAIFDKSAATANAEADKYEAEALNKANQARDAAAKLSGREFSATQYRDELAKGKKAELRTLRDSRAKLEGKRLLPGYRETRADRDQLDLLNRRITAGQEQAGIGAIPEISQADATRAYGQAKDALKQLDPNDDKNIDRIMQLEVQADQYSKIMSGTHTAKDFAPVDDLARGQVGAQQFDAKSETAISTDEAKSKLDKFRLQLQQTAIKLKVDVDMQGMTSGSLQGILENNLALAKQGLKTQGMSSYDAMEAMRNKDAAFKLQAKGIEPDTAGFQGYFEGTRENRYTGVGEGYMDTGVTAFDDLMRQNQNAKSTVDQLHSSADQFMPKTDGLSANNLGLQSMQTDARLAIDELAKLDQHQKAMQAEANVTTGSDRDEKQAQAADLAIQRDKQALVVKRQIGQVETALHKNRIDPSSKEAIAQQTVQIKAQLAAERESLIVERQRLSLRMREGGGKHTSAQDLTRLTQLNSTLNNRFGTGQTRGSASQQEIDTVAKQKGIGLNELGPTGGKAGKSKDFVGGAIDLIDWQLQWLAGVSVLNAVSSAFKNSIGFAVQYEAALKNVELITQANSTEMEQLTGEVTRLATNFQYGALEIGEALVILGQAGFSATQSLAILPNITALATATMANLKVATDITTTAIEAFNVPMAKVPALVNSIAAMTIESKLDIEKLGTSFNYIASTASAAGFSIEETGTAMGLMSNAGVRASTIGTSLRSTIGSLMNPTAKFRKALAEVGLSADDINPATNRLGDIFLKLKVAGFDVASAFAGLDKRIAGGIITLIDSADQFDTFSASITGTNRAFAMAEGQMDTFDAQTKRMKNTFQLLGGSWFQADLSPLKDAASLMNVVLRTGLKMSEATPDGLKTMVNSTLALTTGLSIFGGVGRGILDVNSNIQNALADEKKEFFAPQKNKLGIEVPYSGDRLAARKKEYKGFRGKTLKGRNSQVYTTVKTLFNPQLIGLAALTTATVMAAGFAVDTLSGKLELNKAIKLSDKFESDSDALKEATLAYKEAATGTTEYYLARKRLLDLGVGDFSDQGIVDSVANANAKRDIAKDQVIKKRVSNRQHGWTKFRDAVLLSDTETEQGQKAFASELETYLKDRGLYWTASEGEMLAAFRTVGVERDGKTGGEQRAVELALASVRSSRHGENAAAMARSTSSDKFTENEQALANLPVRRRVLAEERDRAATYLPDFEGQAVGYVTDNDKERMLAESKRLADEAYEAAIKELDKSEEMRVLDLKRAAEDYKRLVMSGSGYGDQSGSQADAEKDLLNAYDDILTIQNDTMRATGSRDGVIKEVKLAKLAEKMKSAKAALLRTGRTHALKSGLPGLQQNLVGMANSFLEYLIVPEDTDQGFSMVSESVDAFKKLDISVMTGLGKKLEGNREAKNLEIANMSHLFKDEEGVLTTEAKAVIDIKYKLKAEDIVQGEMDAALKPLQAVYDKIEAIRNQRTGILTQDFADKFSVQDVLLQSEYSEKAIAGASDVTRVGVQTSPYIDNRDVMRGYSASEAARDKIESEKRRLALKQTADQGAYDTAAAALATSKATKLEQLGRRGFANEQRRSEERIKIETDYTQKAIALSKKRRTEIMADLKAVQSIREQHASKITKLQSIGDDVKTSYTAIVDKAKAKTDPDDKVTANRLRRRAHQSYVSAKDMFKAGDTEGGTASYKKAQGYLNQIVDGDYSKDDIRRAGVSAAQQRTGLGFTLQDAVSAEKKALSATENLLTKILNVLKESAGIPKNGTGSITYDQDVTHPDGSVTKEKRTVSIADLTGKPKLEGNPTNVGTASYIDKDGNKKTLDIGPAPETKISGTESLVDNETKLKNLLSEGEVNQKELETRLEAATKSVQQVAGGMADKFIKGVTAGAPIIGKIIGDAAYESIMENAANIEQAKKDAKQAVDDTLQGNDAPSGQYELKLKIDENKFGIAVDEVIRRDLVSLRK